MCMSIMCATAHRGPPLRAHNLTCYGHSSNIYCQPTVFQAQRINQIQPFSSLQSSATFSQNISYWTLSDKLGIYDGREMKEQDTEDPQLSLIMH